MLVKFENKKHKFFFFFLAPGCAKQLLKLVKILLYLDDNLPYSMKMNFDKNLKHLKSPIAAMNEFFSNDLNPGEEDTVSLFFYFFIFQNRRV